MKLLLLFLFIFGLANAQQELFESSNNFLKAFADEVTENVVEEKIRQTIIEKLRESLEDVVNKIKDRIDNHRENLNDLISSANEIANRLKDMGSVVSNHTVHLVNKTRGRAREILKKLINRLFPGQRFKRDLKDALLLAELESESLLKKVTEKLTEELTKGEFIEYVKSEIEKLDDELKTKLLKELDNKTIEEIEETLIKLLANSMSAPEDDKEKSEIRKFFEKLTGNFKERYGQFYEWLTRVWGKGISKAKDKHQEFRAIAKEAIEDIKTLHKETIREIVEILRPHREELGKLWSDLLNKAREALKRKD